MDIWKEPIFGVKMIPSERYLIKRVFFLILHCLL